MINNWERLFVSYFRATAISANIKFQEISMQIIKRFMSYN